MYCPSHFQLNDRNAQLAYIKQHSFGQLITTYQGQLEINQLPFLLDEAGEFLYAHVAKANTHWQCLCDADDLKVCFSGANAYISPNWYADKGNVPTWNFMSVQVSGHATLLNDCELLNLLNRLSEMHESQFETPWTIKKMDTKKLSAMLKAIVGFKISIESIEGKAKLSQNKSPTEIQSLIHGLEQQEDYNSNQVAQWMKQFNF
ncbi:FMN-binding negative transcriptional regulator [Aliikangiella sp. IMCC44359]|uniref:FMN-binding negative transcriptional regulator n=1 Tax=Aliikangiella sp. IMCC44359 TaxID=3459125 RepID=UPI00403B22AF